MKKYTLNQVKDILKQYDFELLSNIYKGYHKNITYKDNIGFYYYTSLCTILSDSKPLKFHKLNPYTIQNIKLWLNLNNKKFELISTNYIDISKKIILQDKLGYFYNIKLSNLLAGNTPNFVHKSNLYTIYNIKLWCKLNNKSFELLSEKYENNHKKLKWKCLKDGCGEEFEVNWNNILDGKGCGFCAGRQVGLSNCLATKNPELAEEWHPTLNGELTPYDITCGSSEYAWWKCKECGHEWYVSISNRRNSGCPECNKSKDEKRISEVLIFNNLIKISQDEFDQLFDKDKYNKDYFIPQKEFNGLVGTGGGLLSYDFYIPKYNLLIEYQGNFHDGTARGQTEEDFKKQFEHDRRKKEYAKNNNIKFLEIWYYDFNKIEEILERELKYN